MEQKYKDMISEVCKVKRLLIKFRNLTKISFSISQASLYRLHITGISLSDT